MRTSPAVQESGWHHFGEISSFLQKSISYSSLGLTTAVGGSPEPDLLGQDSVLVNNVICEATGQDVGVVECDDLGWISFCF